jgi:Putative metallopeptidase
VRRHSITTHVADIRRRACALSLLTTVAIAGVAAWRLPATHTTATGTQFLAQPVDSDSQPAFVNSRTRRGFKLLNSRERLAGVSSSASLRADSEAKVRALVTRLNASINLPVDIQISFEDCHDSEVYYDDQNHHVVICHEWLDEMQHLVSRRATDKTLVRESVESLVIAVFLHESAHALIDILHVPVTGREEDAADQFSTLVLMGQPDGARKAMQVAHTYKVLSQDSLREPPAYWDEHSLDAQRYYDTLCMIYGRDPKQNAKLMTGDRLPDERAEICEKDYQRIETAWKTLLRPYAKDSLWQSP